jgi:RNA-directed DNA polymerase
MKKKYSMPFKDVIKMTNTEARIFFLKNESYCNFELPKYFNFSNLLSSISEMIEDKRIADFYKPIKNNSPKKYDDVNHTILHNKDGRFAWRNLELINPVLYVALSHAITTADNWNLIVERFIQFRSNKKIECMSLPIESTTSESDKAKQVKNWWHSVEQQSIQLSMDYEFIFKTDITDCYPSIYTHSIAWALHGKPEAKKRRYEKNLVGNIIDDFFCDMSNGQTNGIPQGSTLTDFIAEMVLGYADLLLTDKIDRANISEYKIIRYRDDYRIFVANSSEGDHIVKILCEVLIGLGLKLNPSKTISSENIIEEAIKEDKRFWAFRGKKVNTDLQTSLLVIHDLSGKYSNSGSLIKALVEYNWFIKNKKIRKNIMVLISIIVDIAYNNPKVYPISAAILSKLLSCIDAKESKIKILEKVENKFKKIPNTGHLQIWLQRIALRIDRGYEYFEPLCQLVAGKEVLIWNFEWLKDNFTKKLDIGSIIDRGAIEKLTDIIDHSEVSIFKLYD